MWVYRTGVLSLITVTDENAGSIPATHSERKENVMSLQKEIVLGAAEFDIDRPWLEVASSRIHIFWKAWRDAVENTDLKHKLLNPWVLSRRANEEDYGFQFDKYKDQFNPHNDELFFNLMEEEWDCNELTSFNFWFPARLLWEDDEAARVWGFNYAVKNIEAYKQSLIEIQEAVRAQKEAQAARLREDELAELRRLKRKYPDS